MTRADVRAFTTSKVEAGPLKPKTINNILVPLGLILKQAAEDGCTVNSPETGLRRVKVHRPDSEWYEVAEAEKLLRATPKEWRALIGLAVHAGLRQGEILALRWSDIDWAGSRIHVRLNLQSKYKVAAAWNDRSIRTIQIVHVAERISIAKTYRYRRVNVGGTGALDPLANFRTMLAAPRYVRRYETLKLDDEDKAPLRESDSYVKVGDPVRELIEPQAEEAPD